jgi:hypothetical protein
MMAEIPAGSITAADVFRETSAMRGELGQAMGKLAAIDVRTAAATATLGDHEVRIRVLEQFRNKLLGVAVVVALSSGSISGFIGFAIGHIH